MSFWGPFLRHILSKSNTFGEMWQRWRAVCTIASDLADPTFDPQTSRFTSNNCKLPAAGTFFEFICSGDHGS